MRGLKPEAAPLCPICGAECSTVYVGYYGDIVGCDECIGTGDAWDCDECFPGKDE